MSGEIEVRPLVKPASAAIMDAAQFDSVWRMSKALAESGSFKDIGKSDGAKALARILLGADLGMSPTQALMGIDIVKGNPQIRGVALGRMVRLSSAYDYAVLDRGFTPGEEYAVVALYRRDETGAWPVVTDEAGATFPTAVGDVAIMRGKRLPEAIEAFTIQQAIKRGLVKETGAWAEQPEVMCVWRALSQLVRFNAPDVIGGLPVYTEADSFESTAEEIGVGEGDGSEPGWAGLQIDQVRDIEALMEVAATFGHPLDRAAVQMRLNERPEAVEAWLNDTRDMLATATIKEADEPEEQQELGGEA